MMRETKPKTWARPVARRPSSETGTRNGVKQKTEAERSNMVVEFNHLLPVMPELGMGLPNTYDSES